MQENRPEAAVDDGMIDIKEILSVLRKNRKSILRFGLGTLGITLLICAAFFCLCPRTDIYSVSLSILLEQKNGQYLYPSGRPFSSADLISHPVLWEVYENCNLKDTVTFEKFQRSFFISQQDPKFAKIDAQFQAKLKKKDVSIVDVKQLEREYLEELNRNRSAQLTISMIPTFPVGRQQASRILNAVPETWFTVYSKLEARPYPQIETSSNMQTLKRKIGKEGQLVLLEKSRQFCQQLINMCDLLNNMLQGKNISLKSGEFIGDLRANLTSLMRYQINVLQQYVLTHPEYQRTFDRIFLESCLQNVNMDLERMRAKYDGAVESLNLVSATRTVKTGSAAAAAGGNGSAITMQLDNGIFNSMAELIRNDATNDMRRVYAEKTMNFKEQSADLEADRKRYQEILGVLDQNRANKGKYTALTPEQFNAHMQTMFDELLKLGDQVVQFRDRVINEFLSSRQFCAINKDTKLVSEPVLPMKRVLAGLILLWMLLNFCRIVSLFYSRKEKEA